MGARLRINTAVVTASPQNVAGMLLAFIMDRAMPTTVWFRRSTTPFCCGEYGAVWLSLSYSISYSIYASHLSIQLFVLPIFIPIYLILQQVDVYSFGIIMWEILTGQEPYAGMHHGGVIGVL